MTQQFVIQYKLPSLNEITRGNRTHWSKGYRDKQEIEDIIGWTMVSAKIEPVVNYPCVIKITYYEPNKRRDVDNVYSASKFILDAMQRYNIILNDSPRYVRDVVSSVVYIKNAVSKTLKKGHFVEVEIVEHGIK